jgi:hypothetical protein
MDLDIETEVPPLRQYLEDRYNEVVAHFNFPADASVLCHFAKDDDPKIMKVFGETNRGFRLSTDKFFAQPKAMQDDIFSDRLKQCLLDDQGRPRYDNLIYLSKSATSNEIGFIMTLAHELQHAYQRLSQPAFLEECSSMSQERSQHRAKNVNPPHEKEAMFVAGKIAKSICGQQRVERYIQHRLEQANAELIRWQYQAKPNKKFSQKKEMDAARKQHQALCKPGSP